MSNNQKNLLSFLMGCVLAFGFLEVWFRLPVWLNDPLFPIFKVNAYAFQDEDDVVRYTAGVSAGHLRWDGESHIVHINQQGFRGDVWSGDASGGDVSVLLGDSIIFNGGVTQEEALDALLSQSGGQRVLNYGISGTSLYHYQQRLEHDILTQQSIKRVYLCFFLNDFIRDPTPPFLRSYSRRQLVPTYRFHSYAIAHFGMLFRSAWVVFNQVPENFIWVRHFHQGLYRESPEQWEQVLQTARLEWGSAWDPERWDEYEQRISEMSGQCKQHGVELMVVIFPVELQVSPDFLTEKMTYPQMQARRLAEKYKLPVIDLLPAFRAHTGDRLFFDHCHLTPTGNRVAAAAIAAGGQPR